MMARRLGEDETPSRLSDSESDLRRLQADMERLEKEYQLFFADQRQRPPNALRLSVERLVRRLDLASMQSSSDRFRLETLQHRFRTFTNLWDRGVRAREEGRPGPFSRST
jgi:hypothetical protein